jgi:subtilase family serine protease
MRRTTLVGRSAAGIFALASCGAALAAATPAAATAQPAKPLLSALGATAKLATSVPSLAAGSEWSSAASSSTSASALVALQHQNESGLATLVSEISNPKSSQYEHYLTTSQFDARFAPTPATVSSVETYLKTFGLTIASVPANRAYVYVTGNVGDMSRAFDTTIDSYMRAGNLFQAPRTQLSIPASLKGVITAVTGLDTGDIEHPDITTGTTPLSFASASPAAATTSAATPAATPAATASAATANDATGCVNPAPATPTMTTQASPLNTPPDAAYVNAAPFSTSFDSCAASQAPGYGGTTTLGDVVQGYTPQQVEGAYGISGALTSGLDGAGETVAVIDAYSSPTMTADADEWSKNMGLPVPKLTLDDTVADRDQPDGPTLPTDVPVVGGAALLSPSGWFGEESLDVEAVHAVAPDASIVVQSATGAESEFLEMAQNKATEIPGVSEISNSYGGSGSGGDATDTTSDGYWMAAAALGIGVEFSSGDSGDNSVGGTDDADAGVDDDANSPYVTAVGGTALAVGPSDNYEWETYWNDQTATDTAGAWGALSYDGGGGGGTSEAYDEPPWQDGVVPSDISDYWINNANAESGAIGVAGRAVPDVAMLADPNTGFLMGDTQDFSADTDPLDTPNALTDEDAYDQYRIGGTSLSSPLFAGMMALANEANGKGLGFADPALYALYTKNAAAYHDPDINSPVAGIVRTNYNDDTGLAGDTAANTTTVLRTFDDRAGVVQELPGYDDSTGLGSPNGLTFLCGLAPNSTTLKTLVGSPCNPSTVTTGTGTGGGTGTSGGGTSTTTTTTTTPGSTTTVASTTTTPGKTTVVTKTTTKSTTTTTCKVPTRLSFVQHPAYPTREVKALVYVNGKKVRTVEGKRIVDLVVSRTKAAKLTVTIVSTLNDGEVVSHTYRYSGCKITYNKATRLHKPTHRVSAKG